MAEERTQTQGVLTERLSSVQRRMQDVSEEELLEALSDTSTFGATVAKTLTVSVERQARIESASTQTA